MFIEGWQDWALWAHFEKFRTSKDCQRGFGHSGHFGQIWRNSGHPKIVKDGRALWANLEKFRTPQDRQRWSGTLGKFGEISDTPRSSKMVGHSGHFGQIWRNFGHPKIVKDGRALWANLEKFRTSKNCQRCKGAHSGHSGQTLRNSGLLRMFKDSFMRAVGMM